MDIDSIIQAEFSLSDKLTYLNHAAVAPWPNCTTKAIIDFTKENNVYGATYYPKWNEVESQLRTNLAKLINAENSDDIALVKNTSEALSMVAYGINWQPYDNIVTSDEEFPSNRIVWQSLADKQVTLNEVNLSSNNNPEDALLAACDKHTRLLAISSTQYSSGINLDLVKLGNACKQRNILFCVDAIQTIGALQFDVQAINADFVMADGHKWMLAPEGLALFYCHKDIRPTLKLNEYGWHMTEDLYNFNSKQWQIAESARRFECGSPNMLAIHGLNASISLLLEIGMENVELSLKQRTEYLFELLNKNNNIQIHTPQEQNRYAGITTFSHKTKNNNELFDYLWSKNIICAQRGNGIRFSPHFYTKMDDLKAAVNYI